MQRSGSVDDIAAIDSDNSPFGKYAPQRSQCHFVVVVLKGRNQDDVICDVKIHVAGRESSSRTANMIVFRTPIMASDATPILEI